MQAPLRATGGPQASPEELREDYQRLRRSLDEDPGAIGDWLLLGDICFRLGRKEEAKGILIKAVERESSAHDGALEILRRHLTLEELDRIQLQSERHPFWQEGGEILRYPLRGNGPAILIGGAVVFTGLTVLAFLTSIFFWLPAIITAGYVASYLMTVIDSSARGNLEPPDYPDFLSFWDSVVAPFLISFCASLLPALLPVLYMVFVGFDLGVVPLVALGLLYWPMALIAGAVFQSCTAALNVPLVIRAIGACGGEYFLGVGVIYGLATISWILEVITRESLPFLFAQLIVFTVSLYFLLLEMHLLGRIYLNHQRAIGWFETDPHRAEPAASPAPPAGPRAQVPPAPAPGGPRDPRPAERQPAPGPAAKSPPRVQAKELSPEPRKRLQDLQRGR